MQVVVAITAADQVVALATINDIRAVAWLRPARSGEAADQDVIAQAAIDLVCAAIAADRVVAVIAAQVIVLIPAGDEVRSTVAEDLVAQRGRAAQHVVTFGAEQAEVFEVGNGVGTPAPVVDAAGPRKGAHIDKYRADQIVVAVGDEVEPVAAVHGVVAGIAAQIVVAKAALQVVVAITAADQVVAVAAIDRVPKVARLRRRAGRGAAKQHIVTGTAVDIVRAALASDEIVTVVAGDRIVTVAARDGVVACIAGNRVRIRSAGKKIVARGASDDRHGSLPLQRIDRAARETPPCVAVMARRLAARARKARGRAHEFSQTGTRRPRLAPAFESRRGAECCGKEVKWNGWLQTSPPRLTRPVTRRGSSPPLPRSNR